MLILYIAHNYVINIRYELKYKKNKYKQRKLKHIHTNQY